MIEKGRVERSKAEAEAKDGKLRTIMGRGEAERKKREKKEGPKKKKKNYLRIRGTFSRNVFGGKGGEEERGRDGGPDKAGYWCSFSAPRDQAWESSHSKTPSSVPESEGKKEWLRPIRSLASS